LLCVCICRQVWRLCEVLLPAWLVSRQLAAACHLYFSNITFLEVKFLFVKYLFSCVFLTLRRIIYSRYSLLGPPGSHLSQWSHGRPPPPAPPVPLVFPARVCFVEVL
ncbi:unnamed protein product, partial [Discosporangium mesarthrocarpum]